jgi:uncharacterized membrane protein YuzA (DUF378 family)
MVKKKFQFRPEHALLLVGAGAGFSIARAMGRDLTTQIVAAIIGFAAVYGSIALIEYSVVSQIEQELQAAADSEVIQ